MRYWKITHSAEGLEKRQNLAITHRGMTAFRPVVPRRFSIWCVIFHCCIFDAPTNTRTKYTAKAWLYSFYTDTVFCQVQPLQNQFSIFLRASFWIPGFCHQEFTSYLRRQTKSFGRRNNLAGRILRRWDDSNVCSSSKVDTDYRCRHTWALSATPGMFQTASRRELMQTQRPYRSVDLV